VRRIGGYVALVSATLALWQVVHVIAGPNLVSGPLDVWLRGVELTQSGRLQENLAISAERLVIGWAIGCVVSIPLGLLMAQIPLVRRAVEPYLHFFRFIPPIAFVSLALIWFGIGEMSKIVLIVYTTSFTVTVATLSGALSVRREAIWAARSLGATSSQIPFVVVVPATLPSIITGVRLAMGTAFKTIIGAEMIGAKSGLGFMIWDARGFLDFETIFVGIVALALMGLFADWLLRVAMRPLSIRYGIAV
jgi:ABC-type nitrate/sulfonate/bicarbonate transport system permease component